MLRPQFFRKPNYADVGFIWVNPGGVECSHWVSVKTASKRKLKLPISIQPLPMVVSHIMHILNADFYSAQPNILLIETLLRQQTSTYISLASCIFIVTTSSLLYVQFRNKMSARFHTTIFAFSSVKKRAVCAYADVGVIHVA